MSGFGGLSSGCVLQDRVSSSKTPERKRPTLYVLRRVLQPTQYHDHACITRCGSSPCPCFSVCCRFGPLLPHCMRLRYVSSTSNSRFSVADVVAAPLSTTAGTKHVATRSWLGAERAAQVKQKNAACGTDTRDRPQSYSVHEAHRAVGISIAHDPQNKINNNAKQPRLSLQRLEEDCARVAETLGCSIPRTR